jgi:hypothetical protein
MSQMIFLSDAPPELAVTAFHGGRVRGACRENVCPPERGNGPLRCEFPEAHVGCHAAHDESRALFHLCA